MKKDVWNISSMIGLIILTPLISPVGIIVGSMNLKYEGRRKQAVTLLVLGIVVLALTGLHLFGHHH